MVPTLSHPPLVVEWERGCMPALPVPPPLIVIGDLKEVMESGPLVMDDGSEGADGGGGVPCGSREISRGRGG